MISYKHLLKIYFKLIWSKLKKIKQQIKYLYKEENQKQI